MEDISEKSRCEKLHLEIDEIPIGKKNWKAVNRVRLQMNLFKNKIVDIKSYFCTAF